MPPSDVKWRMFALTDAAMKAAKRLAMNHPKSPEALESYTWRFEKGPPKNDPQVQGVAVMDGPAGRSMMFAYWIVWDDATRAAAFHVQAM